MNDGMLMPYNKLFEKMEREEKRAENRAQKGKKIKAKSSENSL